MKRKCPSLSKTCNYKTQKRNNQPVSWAVGYLDRYFGEFKTASEFPKYSYAYFQRSITTMWGYILLTLGVANLTILTTNLMLLLVFWGFLGITLYLMINYASPQAASGSKKTFIIVGGADAFLLLGIGILWKLTGSFEFPKISIQITNCPTNWLVISFLCFVVASFAKAGAFPFHTWIPEISETTSIPVLAYLPASMDKLLGIYLLARVSLDIFKLPQYHPLAQLPHLRYRML